MQLKFYGDNNAQLQTSEMVVLMEFCETGIDHDYHEQSNCYIWIIIEIAAATATTASETNIL